MDIYLKVILTSVLVLIICKVVLFICNEYELNVLRFIIMCINIIAFVVFITCSFIKIWYV
jgi:hypothetical protein